MSLVAKEELRDLAKNMESQKQSQASIIRLLAALLGEDQTGTLALTSSTGTDTATPAGAKYISIKSTTGPTTVLGRTLATNDIFELSAPLGSALPAVTPSGGNWTWIALS